MNFLQQKKKMTQDIRLKTKPFNLDAARNFLNLC